MAVNIRVDLRTRQWEDFCRESPKFSIALDGYVSGPPRYDPAGPHLSLNHHEEVDRLATRSTCAQVLMAIRHGLFERFRLNGEPEAKAYVNDCDEDVCLSIALLQNHHLVETASNPRLNRLVAMEDALDCTAGAYPFHKDLPILREMAWIFEPYRSFRARGGSRDTTIQLCVICDVGHRIWSHVMGHGKELPLDMRYSRIGGGKGWAMVQEEGPQARTGMFADGIRIFLSVRERPDGRYQYVIGKMSPFLELDLVQLTRLLNEAEANPDLWGGGDAIIGSPRQAGSKLKPEEVGTLIDTLMPR